MRRARLAACLAIAGIAALAPEAWAQPRLASARVVAESATIYARCDSSSPARAVVKRGTMVTVEAVNEGWVSVFVEAIGERGCLKRAELEASEAIERAGDAHRTRQIERTRAENPISGAAPAPRVSTGGPRLRVAAYGSAGLFTATAKDSFEAILEKRSGVDVGAGVQVAWRRGRLRGLFVEGDLSRFEETGERVFVDNRDVYRLGIPLTITLTPIELSAGYRAATTRRGRDGRITEGPASYFAGGGVGTLRYREADDEETITDSFTSYQVMGGAEFRVWGPLHVGADARYRWVPDALGVGGVSEAFEETDLGGTTFRVRIGVAF